MDVLFILACILYLTNVSEMRPQHHQSSSGNWKYGELSQGHQAPIPSLGQYPGFTDMNIKPPLPLSGQYNKKHRSLHSMFASAGNDAIHFEDDLEERTIPRIKPFTRNRTRIHQGTRPHITLMEDGSFRMYTEEPERLYEPRPSYVEPSAPLPTRVGLNNVLGEGIIVFPDSEPESDIFIPVCAAENASCKDLEDNIPYPSNHIAKAVEDAIAEESLELFGNDIDSEGNISLRIDDPDEISVCPSLKRMLYPKAAKNKAGSWSYIINVEKLQQDVQVETCRDDDIPTMFTQHLPLKTTISCKQKYMYRKFLYLNENGKILSDFFLVPSCCACFEKGPGRIVERMGDLEAPNNHYSIDLNELEDDDTHFSFVPRVGKKGPACAKRRTFCEKYTNYPRDYIINAVNSKSEDYLTLFGIDYVPEGNISQRIDGTGKYSICPSYQYAVYPKAAQNTEGKWFYIVNTGILEQGVQVEVCANDHIPWVFDDVRYGFKARCEQKYMNVKLLFLNEDGELKYGFFMFPSCCRCSVQYKH